MVRARPKSPTAEPADDTVALVATALVTSGRVLPGLAVEGDGRSRSWWWPAPAASQRALVAGLVPDGSADAQRRAASRLAEAVDGMVRDQLAAEKVALVRRRPGRPTLAEAWMRSLVSADPWFPPSFDPAKVRALADVVETWVRSATVVGGRVRLCLRVHEPVGADDWFVELLVQDRDEPGGTGLNLTAASHVIHLDRWWNPAVEDQATDRAYRIGQRRTVQVHKIVAAGTVEERIDEMINAKRDLAQRVVGAGEDWLTTLSTDELRELVGLRTTEIA